MPESHPIAWLGEDDGSVTIGFGPFSDAAVPPGGNHGAFYINDYALSDAAPWKVPARVECLSPAEIRQRFPLNSIQATWQPVDAIRFSDVFQQISRHIECGNFEKTVPVVTEIGTAVTLPGDSLAARSLRATSPLVSYGFRGTDSGFAGATPERLFSSENAIIRTMALAGTAKPEDQAVFAADDKEIREHEYVSQAIVSKLAHWGKPLRKSREILDLGSLIHFLTRIELEMESSVSPETLIRALHPTPALGPLPCSPKTLGLLLGWRKLLNCPPGFGAPFGFLRGGIFRSVVAIRGIWWNGKSLALPAGCGVIEASRLVNEWRELRLKREAVKKLLLET